MTECLTSSFARNWNNFYFWMKKFIFFLHESNGTRTECTIHRVKEFQFSSQMKNFTTEQEPPNKRRKGIQSSNFKLDWFSTIDPFFLKSQKPLNALHNLLKSIICEINWQLFLVMKNSEIVNLVPCFLKIIFKMLHDRIVLLTPKFSTNGCCSDTCSSTHNRSSQLFEWTFPSLFTIQTPQTHKTEWGYINVNQL